MSSDVQFVEKGDFVCGLCEEMLIDAVSARCGHRFCQTCMDSYLNQHQGETRIPCPVFRRNSSYLSDDVCVDITTGAVFPDYNTRRQMKNLPVYCPNRKEGCQETMESKLLQTHLNQSCRFQTMPCSFQRVGCEFVGTRHQMEPHYYEESTRHLELVRDNGGARLSAMEKQLLEMNERLSVELANVNSRMAEMETVGLPSVHCGEFTWRIPNYFRAKQDAVNGTQKYVESPIFYTHQGGYKVRARFYPNGDSSAKLTHASVFLLIMRGEYDPILTWPFTKTVAFTLMDQGSSQMKQNHSDSFTSDPTSDSFQRPRSDMNKASGLPRFIYQDEVESPANNFLINDTLFMKIKIMN